MRYSRSKILNVFLLCAIVMSFGGSEFLHHHGSIFDPAHSVSKVEDSHKELSHSSNTECPACIFSHASKNASCGAFPIHSAVAIVQYKTYDHKFTAVINPYLHKNTGLSPPAVS